MVRYKLILAYDGSAFAGSQRQTGRRTIQGELESALHSLGWQGRSILLAGRTDTGVHASRQVAAFDLEWHHSPEKLLEALNATLPHEMAVQELEIADGAFHPRFDALSRRYQYRIYCRPVRDPGREKQFWRVWPALDERALREGARIFLGRHDFAAFGSPTRQDGSTIRTLTRSDWIETGDEWSYEIEADSFLYRMVRRLVFVQVALAQGRSSRETVTRALEKPASKNELPAGLAPAAGLTLVEITYGNAGTR